MSQRFAVPSCARVLGLIAVILEGAGVLLILGVLFLQSPLMRVFYGAHAPEGFLPLPLPILIQILPQAGLIVFSAFVLLPKKERSRKTSSALLLSCAILEGILLSPASSYLSGFWMLSLSQLSADTLQAAMVLENLCAFFTPFCGAAFLLVLIGAAVFRYHCSVFAYGAGRAGNN